LGVLNLPETTRIVRKIRQMVPEQSADCKVSISKFSETLINHLSEVSPATSQNIENPGGMEGYAAEQELHAQQQHVNGSHIPMSDSQQHIAHDRRRQSSIHKQASIEVNNLQ
jgi:hypothetical protein